MAVSDSAQQQSKPASAPISGIALLVASAFFMEFLDGTVIANALPDMARSFGVSAVDLRDVYAARPTGRQFSHRICPDCADYHAGTLGYHQVKCGCGQQCCSQTQMIDLSASIRFSLSHRL